MNIELRWVPCAFHDDGAVKFADGYCYKQQIRTGEKVPNGITVSISDSDKPEEAKVYDSGEIAWGFWTDVPVEVEK
jgi:hypothetical protein